MDTNTDRWGLQDERREFSALALQIGQDEGNTDSGALEDKSKGFSELGLKIGPF